jgi:hypothetical protein
MLSINYPKQCTARSKYPCLIGLPSCPFVVYKLPGLVVAGFESSPSMQTCRHCMRCYVGVTSCLVRPFLFKNTIFKATSVPLCTSMASLTSENPPCKPNHRM